MPLSISDGLSAWIKDFMKSDAPQFKGKTKEEIVKMAIAAYTDAGGKLKEEKMKNFKDIREKFKVQTFKGHPRITDIYVQFRGGKGDRITSRENRRDFTSAVKMTLQFLKKNKLKSEPVFSTPEEGSSAYKVSLILNKQEEKTADLTPLANALAVLRTSEDHGMAWAKPVGESVEEATLAQLKRKHKRHIDNFNKRNKDLPSNVEKDLMKYAMDNDGIGDDPDDFDDWLVQNIEEGKYNPNIKVPGVGGPKYMKNLKKSIDDLKNEKYRSKFKSAEITKAVDIALSMSGNMTGAYKRIEAFKKGLANDPMVKQALRLANESVNEGAFSVKLNKPYKRGDEKMYMDIIKKYGGKNLKYSPPKGRDGELDIFFDGGDFKKIKSNLPNKGKAPEWISEGDNIEEKD